MDRRTIRERVRDEFADLYRRRWSETPVGQRRYPESPPSWLLDGVERIVEDFYKDLLRASYELGEEERGEEQRRLQTP